MEEEGTQVKSVMVKKAIDYVDNMTKTLEEIKETENDFWP